MFSIIDPLFGVFAFLAVALIIATVNALVLERPERYRSFHTSLPNRALPFISVLVPARNEEENIEQCITSLLMQDYPSFEVIALDDHSTDKTGQILDQLAIQDTRLRVIQGASLPEGWLGKNWACHQLSLAAIGDFILFVDADTLHHPEALGNAISIMLIREVDMLTALPRQIVITWGEKLIVPIVYWSLMSLMPLPLAHRLKLPLFSAAVGQFIFFRRQAYDKIGGHAAIRGHGADDLALARLVKIHQLPWRLIDGGERVITRMYRNFHQAFEGFSKNLFAAFDYRILPFLFAWLWIGMIFYEPPIAIVLGWMGVITNQLTLLFAGLAIIEAFFLWGLVIWRLRFPWYIFLAYPAIVMIGVFIAFRSVALSLRGRTTWKGRTLSKSSIRWL